MLSTLITKVEENLGGQLTSLEAVFNEKMAVFEARVNDIEDRVSEMEKVDTEKIAHLEAKVNELKNTLRNKKRDLENTIYWSMVSQNRRKKTPWRCSTSSY